MGQCQVAERTAKRVHSKGQQSKSVLPTVPSEAAQYPYTQRKCLRSVPTTCRYSRCRSKTLHQPSGRKADPGRPRASEHYVVVPSLLAHL